MAHRLHLPPVHRPVHIDPTAWSLVLERRYVRLRLLGWMLIGSWQLLSLLAEFVPLDLESRVIRISGKVLGLAGLVLVAYGFERLIDLSHRRQRLSQASADARKTQRP